MQKGNAREL